VGGAVVIGTPGDVYAFYPEGSGFGFGKPYTVHPDQARQLLRALAACGHASEIVAMTHPDCVLLAHNEGRYQICAGERIDTFPDSPYGAWERELKQNAAASLRDYVLQTLDIPFRVVSPAYVRRRPGILEAFYAR
jgi:hypothetical protein